MFVDKYRAALYEDFDWAEAWRMLIGEFLPSMKEYMDERLSASHPLVLVSVIEELQSLLSMFGLFSGESSHSSWDEASVIDEALGFRQRVRELALSQLRSGNREVAQQTLMLCDEFRSALMHQHGIAIKVGQESLLTHPTQLMSLLL